MYWEYGLSAFSLLIHCRVVDSVGEWVLFGVYGPSFSREEKDFLRELDDMKATWRLP